MDYAFEGGAVLNPQGSAAWMESRIGKLTASRMPAAMDRLKNGQPSAKAKALLMELASERMTRQASPHYVTPAMLWGKEHEPMAKAHFTKATGVEIGECSFFDHPAIDMFGASPDGLLADDGLIELKCPTTMTHLAWLMQDECPEDYQHQMLAQLVCTGRRWCAFATFDPRMPEPQRMRVWRFEPTQKQRDETEQSAVLFLKAVDDLVTTLSTPRTIVWPPRLAA